MVHPLSSIRRAVSRLYVKENAASVKTPASGPDPATLAFAKKEAHLRLEKVKHNLTVMNASVDKEEWLSLLAECKKELQQLIPLEPYVTFHGPAPSRMLEQIQANEKRLLEALEARRAAASSPGTPAMSLSSCDRMDGAEFEQFCARLLKKNGYPEVKTTRSTGDQGIDIIACRDGIRYGIQCKCYAGAVGNKAVQEAFTGAKFYNCHVAIVMTNRSFTASAQELAAKSGVVLWGRDVLERFIKTP